MKRHVKKKWEIEIYILYGKRCVGLLVCGSKNGVNKKKHIFNTFKILIK